MGTVCLLEGSDGNKNPELARKLLTEVIVLRIALTLHSFLSIPISLFEWAPVVRISLFCLISEKRRKRSRLRITGAQAISGVVVGVVN